MCTYNVSITFFDCIKSEILLLRFNSVRIFSEQLLNVEPNQSKLHARHWNLTSLNCMQGIEHNVCDNYESLHAPIPPT